MTEADLRAQSPKSLAGRFWHFLVLIGLLCIAATLLCATVLYQRSYTAKVDEDLRRVADVLAQACEMAGGWQEDGAPYLADLGETGPRVTLFDEAGDVLYDSAVADAAALPNHADRPEFIAAMETGSGASVRESETLGHETHYYARRVASGGQTLVLRTAEDVGGVWALTTSTLPFLCVAALLVLAAAALLSWRLTRRLVAPITRMAEHLDTIEAEVPYQELEPLAHTVQSDRKLREDNETMRREFTANVSHELKTPLTSISGYAELIENGMAKPEDVPAFGARIHQEASRMIALVSDILQLSELDGMHAVHSDALEMAPVDLAALVKEVSANMQMNARKAYVTMQYQAGAAVVTGSRDMLTELVTNLCDNAIRYNRPGGHVVAACGTNSDGSVWFQVEDNGIGIPKDAQNRVFERFYRVDKSRSKATGGTGLGLAIVKHIALLHKAQIELKSQVGSGTTIRVVFPKN